MQINVQQEAENAAFIYLRHVQQELAMKCRDAPQTAEGQLDLQGYFARYNHAAGKYFELVEARKAKARVNHSEADAD